MRFHLNCSALVQIRPLCPEDEAPAIHIHGFYPSDVDALEAVATLRPQLAKAWSYRHGSDHRHIWPEIEYNAGDFFAVNLDHAEFSDLYELDTMIETSAFEIWQRNVIAQKASA